MTHDMSTFVPSSDRQSDLRRAFGRYGTGVTVVTAQTPDGPVGMTANSFASVSLVPPLVLWSPATSSKRHDAFANAQRFNIHVLCSDQLALAKHFAGQGHDFDGIDWVSGRNGAPTLAGCMAVFDCDLFAVHPAGDHSLILGQVTHASENTGDVSGLLFKQGLFGSFAAQ